MTGIDRIEATQRDKSGFKPPAHWEVSDVANVMEWMCLPLISVIEGMIAIENLVLMVAATQTGKTLFGLYTAHTIATGGKLLDQFQAEQFRVCYFVLEDPMRRIRDRLLDMHLEPTPRLGEFHVCFAPGLNLRDELMFDHVEDLIERYDYRVIFIDTYQKATPGISSFADEDQSRILHRLSDITRRRQVAIVVLDHLRKPDGKNRKNIGIDDIKGTGGKAQNADSIILLNAAKPSAHTSNRIIKFQCHSKDWDHKLNFDLEIAPQGSTGPKFQIAAQSDASAGVGSDKVCRAIVESIGTSFAETSCGEIAQKIGQKDSTVRKHLAHLVSSGFLTTNGKEKRWTRYKRLAVSLQSDDSDRAIARHAQ